MTRLSSAKQQYNLLTNKHFWKWSRIVVIWRFATTTWASQNGTETPLILCKIKFAPRPPFVGSRLNRRCNQTYLFAITVRQKRYHLVHATQNTNAIVNQISTGRLAIESLDLLSVEHRGPRKSPIPTKPYVAEGTLLDPYWRTLCHGSSRDPQDPLRRATAVDQWVHDVW